MTKCKCGCGEEVKVGNVYIDGHSRRGKHHTIATKEKMGKSISIALKGRSYEDIYGGEKSLALRNMRKERMLERWENDDDYVKQMTDNNIGKSNHYFGKHHSKEVRQQMSASHTGKGYEEIFGKERASEIKRIKSISMRGERNCNWNGGKSFEPYCEKFDDTFKESIRDKFNRVCFLCQRTEEENGRKLNVHHVNYNKDCLCDDTECEFVPLCNSCHIKTNYNREYWEMHILGLLEVYPKTVAGENDKIVHGTGISLRKFS